MTCVSTTPSMELVHSTEESIMPTLTTTRTTPDGSGISPSARPRTGQSNYNSGRPASVGGQP
jgi:hypothetical protein